MILVPIVTTPKGIAKPKYCAQEVFAAFREVQEFYRYQLGATFILRPPVMQTLPQTWGEITATPRYQPFKDCGANLWFDTMKAAVSSRLITPGKATGYFQVFLRPAAPVLNINGFGGMVGLENLGAFPARPGMACVADEKAWYIAGLGCEQAKQHGYDLEGMNRPRTRTAAIGSLAHEIVHIASDLPHDANTPGSQVTAEWYYGIKTDGLGTLTDVERTALLATGFFSG